MSAIGQFFTNDWYFAYPMLCMSITGMMLVIWRLLLNINGNTQMNEFLPLFQEKLEREGIDSALRFCRTRTDIIPRRLYVSGLETSKQGTAAMRRAMANTVELEVLPDLNFLLPSILAIAKVATMVGLLGTVISMINTFSAIQVSNKEPTAHSAAIGLALFATALGLVTAIPLVFSHVLFKAWVAKFEVRMKSAAQKLLILVQSKLSAGTLNKAAPAAAIVAPTQPRPGTDPSAARRSPARPRLALPRSLMAAKRRFLDVWLVESNTVYREVPFTVVADWVQQSRLLPDDMLRPSGTAQWYKVGASPEFTPYIPRSEPYRVDDRAEAEEPVELDFAWKRRPEEEDDDVDMIPLIDISLVLLIFFIMTTTSATAAYINNTPAAVHGLVTSSTDMLWIGIKNDKDGTPHFSIGRGIARPEPGDDDFLTMPDLLKRLDDMLKESGGVDVTIQAEKSVHSGVVRDLTLALGQRDKVRKKYIGVSEKSEP